MTIELFAIAPYRLAPAAPLNVVVPAPFPPPRILKVVLDVVPATMRCSSTIVLLVSAVAEARCAATAKALAVVS